MSSLKTALQAAAAAALVVLSAPAAASDAAVAERARAIVANAYAPDQPGAAEVQRRLLFVQALEAVRAERPLVVFRGAYGDVSLFAQG